MVGALSFSLPYSCIQLPPQSSPKFFFSKFSLHYSFHLLVHKIILTIPTNTPFFYTSTFFHLPIFAYSNPYNLHQKYFSLPHPFRQFRLHQGTYEQGSLVRINTALISVFFLKVSTGITRLTITDSLSLRLRQVLVVLLQVVVSDEDVCNQNGKPSNLPSPIPSNYYHHFHTS